MRLHLVALLFLAAGCGAPILETTRIETPLGWYELTCEIPTRRNDPATCERAGELGDLEITVEQWVEHRGQSAYGYLVADPTAEPPVQAGACFDVLGFAECAELH